MLLLLEVVLKCRIAGWPELRPDTCTDYSTDTLPRAGQIDYYIGTPVAYRTCMHGRRSRQHCHEFVGDLCYRIER